MKRVLYFSSLLASLLLISSSIVCAKVNHITGDYSERNMDISVQALGGQISVDRYYIKGVAGFHREWGALQFGPAKDGMTRSIKYRGLVYLNLPSLPDSYIYDTKKKISRTVDGYTWVDRAEGYQVNYDQYGQFISSALRGRIHVTPVRNEYGDIVGLRNASGKQVFWYTRSNGNINSISDASGRSASYNYNSAGRLSSFTDVLGNQWKYQYNASGRLEKRSDPLGHSLAITYHADGKTASVKDQDGIGKSYAYKYDSSAKEHYARVISSGGQVEEFWYDNSKVLSKKKLNGKLTFKINPISHGKQKFTDTSGNTSIDEYDEYDNMISRTYADGSKVSYTYHPDYALLQSATNENGVITKYNYNSFGDLQSIIKAEGTPEEQIISYSLDQFGQITSITRFGTTHTITYDTYGNVVSNTNPLGSTTTYTHDIMGNVLTLTDSLGAEWNHTYNAKGLPLSLAGPTGITVGYTYDAVGNRLTATDAMNNTTHYTYNKQNRITAITNAAGGITTLKYDLDGNALEKTDPEGIPSKFSYEANGNLKSITDGNGNTISIFSDCGCSAQPTQISFPTFSRHLTYDKRGRVISSKDVLDQNTVLSNTFTYDAVGNQVSSSDSAGRTTQVTYDVLNRVNNIIDPLGGTTSYSYQDGNLISVKDANGNFAFRYEYDKFGRKIKDIRPMGQHSSVIYDGEGRVTTSTNANGQSVYYDYDLLGRLTSIDYYATTNFPAQTTSFTYNRNSLLTGYDDGTTTGSYSYDALGRITSELINYGTFSLNSSYSYFKNGRKKSFTEPNGNTYNYSYDAGGRLQSITIPDQGSVVYNSYKWKRPTKITLPGDSTKEYTYDALLRSTSIVMKDPYANELMNQQYGLDLAGNMISKTTSQGIYLYNYDQLNRLVSVNYPTNTNENFGYDKIGNRTSHNTVEINTWGYNANNELLSRPSATYQYDQTGAKIKQQVNSVSTDYEYDILERLRRVKQGATTIAEYYYDPFGRRLSKTVDGARTYYHYSDRGLESELDQNGQVLISYGYEPNGLWGTNPLFINQNNAYHYYLNDYQGTPHQIISYNGTKLWSATYNAFGKASVDSNSAITNNLRFPGQYFDIETSEHYNFMRNYDVATGRYTQTDSFGQVAGLNHFTYALNNPLRWSDPTGEVIPLILARCFGSCMFEAGAGYVISQLFSQLFGSCPNKDLTLDILITGIAGTAAASAMDCAVECVNPLNWFKIRLPIDQIKKMVENRPRSAKDLDLSNTGKIPPLRQEYFDEVESLNDLGFSARAAGSSPEGAARMLHKLRREIGVKYKNLTPEDELERIYKRNINKYGDKLGPSIEYLRSQGKSWEQIIEGAGRPGGKDLGKKYAK